jgi:abhydrolase domain-containing protein 17
MRSAITFLHIHLNQHLNPSRSVPLPLPPSRFHPPPPFYKIKFNDVTGAYDIEFSQLAAHIEYENLTVELLRTKSKTTIPVLCLKYPGAKLTLIYSHGNATDCGAMFIMYAMLALTLKINVVGYDYTGYGSSIDGGVRPTEKQTYKGVY